MPTTPKTSASPKPAAPAKDAMALLKADHEEVSGLFAEYERTRSVMVFTAIISKKISPSCNSC